MAYALIAGLYGTLGGILTTYYGPMAAGSGVAELIGYLNGVNQPGFLGINTLITKVVGVSLAVSARLAVGKEGPLAHIGAIVGASVLYIPGLGLEHLRNDETKRLFIAAGASTGVSVAFGAPIGGALFCYELSRPNTFWRFTMIWKVFFAASLGTFVMAMWNGIRTGNYMDWSGAQIKFGSAHDTQNASIIYTMPGAIVLGITGGCLGALFINVNTRVNAYRKVLLKSNWIKPIETMLFAILTASIFFIVPS